MTAFVEGAVRAATPHRTVEAAGPDGPGSLHLRLPATSANLGPGFDTIALALSLHLEIDAVPAANYSIDATGRNPEICSQLERNLLLKTYQDTVRTYAGREASPLALTMRNGIPLGMGCGSSAASRLAGVALAAHFGALDWSRARILDEACRLEGHPDNAAACWLGGFVVSGQNAGFFAVPPVSSSEEQNGSGQSDGEQARDAVPDTVRAAVHDAVHALAIAPPARWHALVAMPSIPLATTESRAVLPASYSRADVVLNLQRVALLTAAFAAGRGDLLASATGDSLHQPYRGKVCPLLPKLLPLAGKSGILSVTLSGAGPAVLLLLETSEAAAGADALVREAAAEVELAEVLRCSLEREAAIAVASRP